MKNNSTKIIVFTDGASRGNPGPAGYGAIIVYPYPIGSIKEEDKKKIKVIEIGGGFDVSTNNRMEMSAVLKTFQTVIDRDIKGDIEIYTDSKYVHDGMIGWIYAWEKNNWKTAGGDDVQNQDIWKELLKFAFSFRLDRSVNYVKVDGHSGVFGNERADKIATGFADGNRVQLFTGSLANYEKLIGGSLFKNDGSLSIEGETKGAKDYVIYLSYVDGELKEHDTWESCKNAVTGIKGAKFKKVTNDEEKEKQINAWRGI